MEKKNNKIWLPFVIVLGVLIVAVIALIVSVLVSGSGSTSKKGGNSVPDTTQEETAEEQTYVSDYELGGFSASSGLELTTTGEDPESDPESDPMSDPDAYILPDSATVALTEEDLADLSAKELTYARNEIYARHGRIFESDELNLYFQGKSWYIADEAFDDSQITDMEAANAELISTYQNDNDLAYTPE